MQTWIVECSICHKPFVIDANRVVSAPSHALMAIPEHHVLDKETRRPVQGVPCAGAARPGFGMGSTEEYEERFPGKLARER